MAAGEWRPFFLTDTVVVSANGTAQAVLTVGDTDEFEGDSMEISATSVSGNIQSMVNDGSIGYTNADGNNFIPFAHFPPVGTAKQEPFKFSTPLKLGKGQTLSITVADTSGSENTVRITIFGKRRAAVGA